MHFRRWLERIWFEVVGSGDEKHLLAGTSADLIKSHFGVCDMSVVTSRIPTKLNQDVK